MNYQIGWLVRRTFYLKVHKTENEAGTCRNRSKCNVAYNQSVVKLLDERVLGANFDSSA